MDHLLSELETLGSITSTMEKDQRRDGETGKKEVSSIIPMTWLLFVPFSHFFRTIANSDYWRKIYTIKSCVRNKILKDIPLNRRQSSYIWFGLFLVSSQFIQFQSLLCVFLNSFLFISIASWIFLSSGYDNTKVLCYYIRGHDLLDKYF